MSIEFGLIVFALGVLSGAGALLCVLAAIAVKSDKDRAESDELFGRNDR